MDVRQLAVIHVAVIQQAVTHIAITMAWSLWLLVNMI
jgi:hypothetical protein